MQFSLLSTSRLATPPVFSLSFNVSDGPPTVVECTVNGVDIFPILPKLSRVIVNGPGSITRVTVTVRLREAGSYQCTVFNGRVAAGTLNGVRAVSSASSLNITGQLLALLHFMHALVSHSQTHPPYHPEVWRVGLTTRDYACMSNGFIYTSFIKLT